MLGHREEWVQGWDSEKNELVLWACLGAKIVQVLS